jgi:hypothetical protein
MASAAMTNASEYAVELSDGFWGRNDFCPFTREELIEVDKAGCEAVARLWGATWKPW